MPKHDYHTQTIPDLTPDQAERFWKYVDVRGPDECWPWTSCDRRACCNARHMTPGDRVANNADRHQKGRTARGKRLPHCKLSPEQVLDAIQRCAAGEKVVDVAASLGVKHTSISQILNGTAHSDITGIKRHKKGHAKTLTLEKVREAHRLRAEGRSLREIGVAIGSSLGNVGKIMRGEMWRGIWEEFHLPDVYT